jgi:hypothetical protein
LPNQEVYVAIDYYPLPTRRLLVFNSNHYMVLNAITNTKTPKIVALKNPTNSIITILKRFPIGYITKSKDSGYFIVN